MSRLMFIPGTWADLRPTHRTIPESVTIAMQAVEAAWKRREKKASWK